MTPDTIAVLAGIGLLAILLLILLLRGPVSDPVLAQRLADLQMAQERLAERIATLPGDIGERLSAAALDQTRALGEGLREVQATTARLEAGLRDALAKDAEATRAALIDTRERVTRALAEHQEVAGLLRRDVTQGVGEIRAALAEGHAKQAETLTRESKGSRDLLDAKLRELRESNEQRLAAIEKSVNEQLQTAVEKQMNESFARVIDQFAAVQKAMGEVQQVTTQIVDIKRLFSNVKTRGGWGEAQVKAVLDDILPPGAYEANKRLSEDSSEAVEFALRMPSESGREVFLAVDAKFPTEDWDRLVLAAEAGDGEAERLARRALEQRVRAEAQKIAAKYIRPPLTVEFAVLYLPTEGLYAEIARLPGAVEDIQRLHRVLVLGPSLLPAMLRTIQMGHVTLALGQKADMVRDLLGATKAEMAKMDEVLQRLGKQVRTMGNTIEDAQRRTRAVARKLRGVDAVEGSRAAALLELEAEADAPLGEGDES